MCYHTSVKCFPAAWKCCLFLFLMPMLPAAGYIETQVFLDKHVAVNYHYSYSGSWLRIKEIKWSFQYLSRAWKYVKDNYEPIGADHLLTVDITFIDNTIDFCRFESSRLDPRFESLGKTRFICIWNFPPTSTINLLLRLNSFIFIFGASIREVANGILNNVDELVCAYHMDEILKYDVHRFLKDPTRLLIKWKDEKLKESLNGIFWFRDWFLPIYTNYGGVSVLREFYKITFQHLPQNNNSQFVHTLNSGEFIHFWSEAAGADLSSLALKAFTNDSFEDELMEARETFPFFAYNAKNCTKDYFQCDTSICISSKWRCDGKADCASGNDEFNCVECAPSAFRCAQGSCVHESVVCNFEDNCPDGSDEAYCDDTWYPQSWIQVWKMYLANTFELTRIYIDDDLVVYTELTFNNTSSTQFEIFSLIWKYFKKTSLVSQKNPRLILAVLNNTNNSSCSIQYHELASLVVSNVIECFSGVLTSSFSSDLFLRELEMIDSPLTYTSDKLNYVCKFQTQMVNTYNRSPHKITNSIESYLINKDRCVLDWLFPIYENYGGSKTFSQFFNLTNLYWLVANATENTSENVQFNVGKTVHFWSMAAGLDLEFLAVNAFNWNYDHKRELILSREFYTQLKYKVETEVIQYAKNDVMFYFNTLALYPSSLYIYVSQAWRHQKAVLGSFNNFDSLNATVFMHSKSHIQPNCIPANITQSNSDQLLRIFYCNVSISNDSKTNSDTYLEEVLIKMTQMSLKHHSAHYCPANHDSSCALTDIIMYDIYSAIPTAKPSPELKWQIKQQNDSPHWKLWFMDWYWIIYKRYGKTQVLQNIFFILSKHWAKTNMNLEKQLNMGEYVHFWSEAARVDLRETAKASIGWNETNEAEFAQARKDFFDFKYLCYQCDHMDHPKLDTSQSFNAKENDTVVSIVVGSSVFLLVLVLAGCGIKFRRDKRKLQILSERARNLTLEEITQFYEGNVGFTAREVHAPIYALPFNREYEVSNERLVIDENKILGSGEFGIVKMGLLKDVNKTTDLTVAVKMVKSTANVALFKAFLMEIKIMAYLKQHENIVSLLATVTVDIKQSKVFAALEFCAKGDLLQHIKCNAEHFVDLFNDKTGVHVNANTIKLATNPCSVPVEDYDEKITMSTIDLLEWSLQIANGMSYLGSKNVIHGDLAARNVLLTQSNIAKISDFGLSRQLLNYSIYKKQSNSPLPWRWMALESLDKMIFSHQSDIWAFGVTIWEIFTLGKLPYPGRTWNNEFVQELFSGQRLEKPNFGNKQIYMLLLNCMNLVPAERVSFLEIRAEVDRLKTCLISVGQFN